MTSEQDFFAVFGEISVKFSNLEFMVSQLLQQLVDPQLHAVGGLLTSRMDLGRKIESARQLARVRFCHKPELEEQVRQTLAKVDGIRVDRNAFIHGQWLLDPNDLANDTIKCFDSRWSAVRGGHEWTGKTERVYRIVDLRQKAHEVGILVMEVLALCSRVSQVSVASVSKTKTPEKPS